MTPWKGAKQGTYPREGGATTLREGAPGQGPEGGPPRMDHSVWTRIPSGKYGVLAE